MIKAIITDLDGTLYDWINFFVPAFYKMVDTLSEITEINSETLLLEYRNLHQKLKGTEIPYATRQLPSIQEKYGNISDSQFDDNIRKAYYTFNSFRKHNLVLFPKVEETLANLVKRNITIIGFTESSLENGYYRLRKLGIDHFFSRVYVAKSKIKIEQEIEKKVIQQDFIKPDIGILKSICKRENLSFDEILYIGDSMTKDISMAHSLGIKSVLVKLAEDNSENYSKLVKISHWTEEDFRIEAELKRAITKNKIEPNFIVSRFDEIERIVERLNAEKLEDECSPES